MSLYVDVVVDDEIIQVEKREMRRQTMTLVILYILYKEITTKSKTYM